MKSLILICAVGMAFGQTKIQVDTDKWAKTSCTACVIVGNIIENSWADGQSTSTLDMEKLRSKCPEYLYLVFDSRVKGAFCALRAPWPAESIKLPIPKELRQ